MEIARMNSIKFIVATLTCFLYLSAFCDNAIKTPNKADVKFERYSVKNGLSHNTVLSIHQDSKGFIWFGTLGGLNRFDGYEMKAFQNDPLDSLSISDNHITQITEDKNGEMWLCSYRSVEKYNSASQTFENVTRNSPVLKSTFYRSVFSDNDGNIWIGGNLGLYLFGHLNREFVEINFPSSFSNNNIGVNTIFQDSRGLIWIGSTKGVFLISASEKGNKVVETKPWHKDLSKYSIRSFAEDKNGNIWIGTQDNGVYFIDSKMNGVKKLETYDHSPLPSENVKSIFVNEDNKIWIGTRLGIFIYDQKTKHYQILNNNKYDQYSLSHSSVNVIFRDKNGSIWVGTYSGGVNVIHPNSNNFNLIGETMGDLEGLSYPVVSAVVEDHQGNLWIGTEGGGLNYYNVQTGEYRYFTSEKDKNSLVHDHIKSLLLDDQDNLWIGTIKGLSYYDRRKDEFTNYKQSENSKGLRSNEIYSLESDGDQGVWIGTNGNGLDYISSDRKVVNNPLSGKKGALRSNYIQTLKKDSDGNLWVGTNIGLNYFDTETNKIFNVPLVSKDKQVSSGSHSITAIHLSQNGWIWIGSESGIYAIDKINDKVHNIGKKEGLNNILIGGIAEDETGNIWASTHQGISRVNISSDKENYSLPVFKVTNYSYPDGVHNHQFKIGAFCKSKSGKIYFGGSNGLTYFEPNNIFKNKNSPVLVFTEFNILNQNTPSSSGAESSVNINELDKVSLGPNESSFSITFAALNFISSSKNIYAYKLLGLGDNNAWNYIDHKRTLTFSDLEPGEYTLMVKAANNDGVWSENSKSIVIKVNPPFWKSTFAYIIYFITIAGLLFLFYFYSLKIAKLKNKLSYESLIREKDHDLHQKKLQFFTNISHEIKTPLTLILSPVEKLIDLNQGNNRIFNHLLIIQRNGERLLRLVNQLLDFRKFEAGNVELLATEEDIVKFMKEISLSYEQYSLQKGIAFEFNTDIKKLNLWFDKDKVEKILYNLLSNAFKFADENGKVLMKLMVDGPHLVIAVANTGDSIPSDMLPERMFQRFVQVSNPKKEGTGIGLAYTKELVKLHSGNIYAQNNYYERGQNWNACFFVELPLEKDHFKKDQIAKDIKNSEEVSHYHKNKRTVKEEALSTAKASLKKVKKETLILVEDNSDLREYLGNHFKETYTVYEARDGVEGLEIACEIIPDIVISDVMMPKMTGIAMCEALKKNVLTSHIPVILLTARSPLVFKIEGFEVGADEYVTKPFHLEELDARVTNLLKNRKFLRERFKTKISLQPSEVALSSPDEKFLQKLLQVIEERISDSDLNVEAIGKEVGMSRTHLYRKVKALTNMSMVEFIRDVRIKRAGQLIKQNEMNISEVAYMVGFSDVDYFRKHFKAKYKLTPTEFLKDQVTP